MLKMVKMRYFEVPVVVIAGDDAHESVSRSKTPQLVLCSPSKSRKIQSNAVDCQSFRMVSSQPEKQIPVRPGKVM